MSSASEVVATSPFLTDVQAASELRTSPLNIRRLCARGVLKGNYVGRDGLTITPAALSAYVDSGMPDFLMPEIALDGSWFVTDALYGMASGLGGELLEAVSTIADEVTECPVDRNGKPIERITVPAAGPVLAVLNKKPAPLVRFAGENYDQTPYANRPEGFAVVDLRQFALSAVNSARRLTADENLAGGSDLDQFYRTQDSYRAAVNKAWEMFNADAILVRRTFNLPVDGTSSAKPVQVTWRFPFTSLAVSQQRVTQLAF